MITMITKFMRDSEFTKSEQRRVRYVLSKSNHKLSDVIDVSLDSRLNIFTGEMTHEVIRLTVEEYIIEFRLHLKEVK